MHNINLLPQDTPETPKNDSEKVLNNGMNHVLEIAHGLRNAILLSRLAEKEGVDIGTQKGELCRQLQDGDLAAWIATAKEIIDSTNGDIQQLLADCKITVPGNIQHEIDNNRFRAYQGKLPDIK